MAETEARRAAAPGMTAPRPSLRRSRSDRIVGGVAGGIGVHLAVNPLVVRIAFVVLAFAAGFGVIVYLLLWLLAPCRTAVRSVRPTQLRRSDARAAPGDRARPRRRPHSSVDHRALVRLGARLAGLVGSDRIRRPVGAQRGDEGHGRWDLASFARPLEAMTRGRVSAPRIFFGGTLILGGMVVFLATTTSLSAAANVVLAVIVTVGGLALLAGPWFWRIATELIEERSSRIRSEARAEMAAHLHDSVLQTLALIQRAQEPREMVSLARTQERELRAWLYGRAPTSRGLTLRDAIDAMAGRVERDQQVRVEAIVVGDLDLDDDSCARSSRRAARRRSTPPSTRVSTRFRSTSRSRRRRSARSCATRERASTRPRSRPIGVGSPTRSSTGWSDTAAAPRFAASPGTARRSHLRLPRLRR